MARVAAFAFIRNEADDIGWWIAHYLAAGLDTLIVYDDFSSDGTWAILQASQLSGRVRAMRTDPALPPDRRRAAAWQDAIVRLGQDVDWLGILDIDEYLVFDDAQARLSDRLDGMRDADAVAFSWCVFGAGAHVRKPRVSPLMAYDRHARADFPLHERASLFCRVRALDPQQAAAPLHGMAPERVVMAHGASAVVHDGARIQPDWGYGRIRKYACRSMAHFIERTRDRPQDGLAEWWRWHDRNEDGIWVPGRAGEAGRIQHRLYRELWGRTILRTQLSGVLNAQAGEGPTVERGTSAEAFVLHGERNVIIYDPTQGCLRGVSPEASEDSALADAGLEAVFALRWPELPDWIVLVRQSGGIFEQGQLGLLLGLIPLRVAPVGSDAVSLRLPLNNRYMTLIPPSGQVTFDRQEVQGWEHFVLHPTDAPEIVRVRGGGISALVRRGLTAIGVSAGLMDIAIEQGDALGVVFAMLPEPEQRTLVTAFPGCFPIWLSGPNA